MPLADADIISARLYSNYTSAKEEFNTRWKEIITSSNELTAQKISTIDDILNQYMYILRAKNQEKDSSLSSVRRYFTHINKDILKNPVDVIDDIDNIINIWQDESNIELTNIRCILFKHNSNFKFFYATYLYFNRDADVSEKLSFAKALLKLFALLAIKEYGYSSAKFKTFLISLNMDIGKGVSSETLIQKIDDHIKKEFNKDDVYNTLLTHESNNATVFLNEYLFALQHSKQVNLNVPRIEIEHIMPSSGKNICGVRESAGMNEEEFQYNVNRLGNKILLEQPINGSISNEWFQVKKQSSITEKRGYKNSEFPIAQKLTTYLNNTWGKDDIQKATEKAAKRVADFIFN